MSNKATYLSNIDRKLLKTLLTPNGRHSSKRSLCLDYISTILTLAKRNDDDFRDIHAVIFDWSDPSDWLKVGITIRNAILARYGLREDKETYNKLMSYFHRHLAAKGGRYRDHVKFLKDLGYDYEQAKNAVYKFSSR